MRRDTEGEAVTGPVYEANIKTARDNSTTRPVDVAATNAARDATAKQPEKKLPPARHMMQPHVDKGSCRRGEIANGPINAAEHQCCHNVATDRPWCLRP